MLYFKHGRNEHIQQTGVRELFYYDGLWGIGADGLEKAAKVCNKDMKHGIKGREFFAFITTNATFASDFVQWQIKNIRGTALLIVDEAHIVNLLDKEAENYE